jgi:hypothetical protein
MMGTKRGRFLAFQIRILSATLCRCGFISLILLALPSALAATQRLALTVAVVSNTVDGSPWSECEMQDQVEAGKKHDVRVSFGGVKPRGGQGWEAAASDAHCGSGHFDEKISLLGRGVGIPYIVVVINTIPRVRSGGNVDLETTLQILKFSAFDEKGQPAYTRSEQKRRFDLRIGADAIVPILVADSHEIDAFNVHELFLRLSARVLGREAAAYGTNLGDGPFATGVWIFSG